MIKSKQIVSSILLFFILTVNSLAAELPIKLEVKAFDGNIIFVFYHSKAQQLNIDLRDSKLLLSMSSPTDFELVSPDNFKQFASTPILSEDKKSISFDVNKKYKSQEIINGEKLTAIKLEEDIEQIIEPVVVEKQTKESTLEVNSKEPEYNLVQYRLVKGEPIISFDFGNQDNVGMAAFFRGKYLWVVFDSHKVFSLANNQIFTDFTQLDNKHNTIIKVKIDGYKKARAIKEGKIWGIILSKNDNNDKKSVLLPKSLSTNDGIELTGNFNNSKIIEIEDQLVGDTIKVVTSEILGMRIDESKEFIDFNLIPSIQGVAVAVGSNDNVELVRKQNLLQIISKNDIFNDSNERNKKIRLSADINSLLPLNPKDNKENFIAKRSQLIREIALAEDKKSLSNKRSELANFFFNNGLYKESLEALSLIKKDMKSDYDSSLELQLLTAVNYTLIGNFEEASKLYNRLLQVIDPSSAQEIALWSNYNNFLLEKNPSKIDFIANLAKIINLYPDDLYWSLALAELDINLVSNNLKVVESVFKELRTPSVDKHVNGLLFHKANYYKKKKRFSLAKQFFQELLQKENDIFNYTRAELNLVKLQLSLKEITLEEAIKRLESLKFTWRGDVLEYDILLSLAGYYRDVGNNLMSLRTYMYLSNSFTKGLGDFYITSEMIKIFNSIFLSKNGIEKISPFDAISLFYEFKVLNPIGIEGDKVILSIARLLMKLDLLDQAIELLNHQVSYRLSGEKRIINADHLAIALLMNKKPLEAIKILDETDKDNIKFGEHQYRVRLKSKALIDLQKYDEAFNNLTDDPSSDAMIIKKECLFQSEKWQQYINLIEPSVNKLIKNKITEPADRQDVLRLAIAYYMINDQTKLDLLTKSLVSNDESLKDTIDLLLLTSRPINYKDLDQTLNVNQIQVLLEKYKNQFFNQQS